MRRLDWESTTQLKAVKCGPVLCGSVYVIVHDNHIIKGDDNKWLRFDTYAAADAFYHEWKVPGTGDKKG